VTRSSFVSSAINFAIEIPTPEVSIVAEIQNMDKETLKIPNVLGKRKCAIET